MPQIDDLVTILDKKNAFYNKIEIEILEDGAIRIETGKFDAVQHATAQKMLDNTAKLLGSTQKKTAHRHRRISSKVHQHIHIHN